MNDRPFASKPATVTTTVADPIPHRPSFHLDLKDAGSVRVHCANLIFCGSHATDGHPTNISVMVGQMGCGCGCKIPGRTFEYLLTPDQARMVAKELFDAAEAVDAHAKNQAATYLAAIRSGRGR